MRTPESELILRELRKLNAQMDPTNPDPLQMRKFRDTFDELDQLLHSGADLPLSWITPNAKTILKPHETHRINDFDGSQEEQLRAKGLAWCGHPYVASTDFCNTVSCGNYFHLHHKR